MTRLEGNIILFLKIRSGSVEEAISYLRNVSEVRQVNRLLGHWDILVAGSFPDYDRYRTFAENMEAKPYCERVTTYPCYKEWKRESPPEAPVTGWAMIGTDRTEETFNKLKEYEYVHWMAVTSGDYNVIVYVGAKELDELSDFICSEVHSIPGVKRTETLPSFKS